MTNKVLYIATSDIHIQTFHLPYLKWLKENGCEVHLAVENRGNLKIPNVDQFFYLPFPRSPFHIANYTSYKKLKHLINNDNYDLIHCHTPIPSMLTRLAARKARRKGTKVLYTAHGFHFYKGGHVKNWLFYYPMEWFLSLFTDGIVTINIEDYLVAKNKMRAREAFYIKGIGVNPTKFQPLDNEKKTEICKALGYNENHFILLYIAEFIPRKNHQFVINSIPELVKNIPNLKVLFAGKGKLLDEMRKHANKNNLSSHIDFLGFVKDVSPYAAIADIGISSSKQEGLGLGLAEEMFCSVPIVATMDRGHKEMIIHGETGFMFEQENQEEFVKYIALLHQDSNLREKMGKKSLERAQLFSIENSIKSMTRIYHIYLAQIENNKDII